MHFGAWIAQQRDAKKMTITECAKRGGVAVPVWQRYETSDPGRQWRRKTVEHIALALGVPVAEALAAAGFATQQPTDLPIELINAYLRVPADQRPRFLRTVSSVADSFTAV